ncbi:MAG: NUDIX hydrolase [Synergistaceae bacterium]
MLDIKNPLGEICHSENIFNGKIVNLKIESYLSESGKITKREIVEHASAVAIIAINSSNKICFVKQYRQPIREVLYEIPAGLIEKDESPRQTAIRELQEEIGYRPGRLIEVISFYTSPGFMNEKIILFLATDLIPSKLMEDEDEFIELEWLSFQEVNNMIKNNKIIDGKTLLGFYLYLARRAEICLL